jgi:photosystem II stability/assembly factor-like uncharacterized protein
MKHLVLLLAVLLLVVSFSFGQQPQLSRLAALAGDSTTAMVNRGGIEYLPSGVIWVAVGDYPHTGKNIAYLSTDNGATWVKRPITTNAAIASPGNVTGFTAKDANTAIAGLGTGEILRTTNGGVKWDTVTSYTDGFIDGVRFVSGDTVIAYGDAPPTTTGTYVARSVDAGKTWTRVASLPGDSLNTPNIYAGYASYGNGMEVYGRNVWLTLYNTANDPPSILKSTDAGNTWQWFRVTLPGGPALNYYIMSITFKDANVGYAVCRRAYVNDAAHSNYLVKTTDGGRTWSDTICVEPGKAHNDAKPMTVRAIRGTNTVIAVGFGTVGAKSWISNDNGLTWAPMTTPTPNTNADLRNVVFASATQGIMMGYYNVVKVSIATAVEETRGAVPTAYVLNQNYPNPFNPTTTISYSLPRSSFVDLKVYDLLGRNVATLVQNEQSAGTHSAVFDAKGLASGVYVYTLKAGDFTATKSLVLIK